MADKPNSRPEGLQSPDLLEVLGSVGIDRRSLVKVLGVGTAAGTFSGAATANQHANGGDTDSGDSSNDDHAIHPQFGLSVADANDVPDSISPDHVVELHVGPPSDDPLHPPLFHFEPTGLCVEPGDVVQFTFTTPDHTITAYHNGHGFQQRVPEAVPPFSSPVVNAGGAWLYRFSKPGLYDFYCAPHHILGMAGRIFVGDPADVGVPAYEDTFEGEEGPPPILPPFSKAFLEEELNHFSGSNEDCEWPWLTPREILDADVLDPASICEGDGRVTFEAVLDELDRFDDHGDGEGPPDDGESPLRVTVSCAGDDPATVEITNTGDETVEARDIDDEGMDVITGRPELEPGETLTLSGVGDGTFVLRAFEPGTESAAVGPKIARSVDCGQ